MPQRAEKQEGPLVLEVERFEHLSAGAERVLLRLDGRYGDRPGKRVLDAMLFVDDGLAVHRHAPLEDDDAAVDSWLWRAAFDVPAAYLTDERTRFALESDPGCLIELPRPGELLAHSAIPITARAAHIARRYAVAVAVILAVAVTPGGLPASARTEVLRVHNPDGSVVYMTRDGQTLAQIPADAVIVDQSPQPAAPAPAPQPQPQAPDQQQAPSKLGLTEKSTSKPRSAAAMLKADTARKHKRHTKSPHESKPAAAHPTAGETSPQAAHHAPPKKHPARLHHHAGHRSPGRHVEPPATDDQLQSLPQLLAAPGSDDARLESLSHVAGSAAGRQPAPADLPTKDLQDLAELAGGPAHGVDTAAPLTLPTGADSPLSALAPIAPDNPAPQSTDGRTQHRSRDHRHVEPPKPKPTHHSTGGQQAPAKRAPVRHPDGTPTPSNPTFVDALPGPAHPGAVPDFVIDKFRIPPFLLSIYQAAGIQYGIRWEVLAAINEIETDYGRNLNVSSAGAVGWMQFMPQTWQMYGVDANKDHQKDPNNPVDAIFAAARYLKAAGGDKDIRRGVFAYNHAGWYVDSVMLRARVIAGYPEDLVSSLTGLTEGRFPVAAHARYADDSRERKPGDTRKGVDIFTHAGAPAVAVNDGVVKKIGHTREKGHYVVLQDVYGNQYTYSNLGSVAKLFPVPKQDAKRQSQAGVKSVGANDPTPKTAASAGAQHAQVAPARRRRTVKSTPHRRKVVAAAPILVKKRLFAHPARPVPQKHGGFDQLLDMQSGKGFETYDSYFGRPLGLNSRNARLRRLKVGSHVLASTVLGRVADRRQGKAPHLTFEIRPAGRGAPKIDPKPILDGWKLLESTAIYRAKGSNALYGEGNFSIGEAMLLPKPLLAKRVLSDPRIKIYAAGREDIRTGQIDRRVLVVLEYLAESGLHPTVSCLKSGHSLHTSSGNISEHSSGNAVDIAAINGVPIVGHQGPGDVTEKAVRRLMQLQGTMQPHQIISLLAFGGNTMAMADHNDHIHVGFHPLFGENRHLGEQALSVLAPDQWHTLVQRLGQINNPTVPTTTSRWSIPDHKGDR
jgi:hypothetical protein